jgi:hypothetical protein
MTVRSSVFLSTSVDHGGTLAAILNAYPALQGILFDVPQVVPHATLLDAAGVAEHCKIVGGDMQHFVPAGGDGYLIKYVLVDRSDEQAVVKVCRDCMEAMADNGKTLVVEMVMPSGNQASVSKTMDLQMMLLFGRGRICTEEDLRALFKAADLMVT